MSISGHESILLLARRADNLKKIVHGHKLLSKEC